MQTFGLKALSNPTVKDMEGTCPNTSKPALDKSPNPFDSGFKGYLKYGQIATWPYINAIRDMIRLEKAIDDCLIRLEERMRAIAPELEWSIHDEIESIASGSAVASNGRGSSFIRGVGRPPLAAVASIPRGFSADFREAERMRKRLSALEEENKELRKELEKLRKTSDEGGVQKSESRDEVPGDMFSEGEIFGFLHSAVLRRRSSKSS
jgi:hypothetical protein